MCVNVCEGGAYIPPTTRCWMQPLNDRDTPSSPTGRRDPAPDGSPPMKIEAGDKRANPPGNWETDFLWSSSTWTDRDLRDGRSGQRRRGQAGVCRHGNTYFL